MFAGVVLDSLLFPYPRRLDERNADEARTVRRLIKELRALDGDVIDSAKFDEEETISENVIRAFAEIGMLALTIPKKYGGLELSSSAYARVFEALSGIDGSLAVMVGVHCGLAPRPSSCTGMRNRRSGICRRSRAEIISPLTRSPSRMLAPMRRTSRRRRR
jgi:alkylation response protein AidB-like acyl-CoA dehydrogenase